MVGVEFIVADIQHFNSCLLSLDIKYGLLGSHLIESPVISLFVAVVVFHFFFRFLYIVFRNKPRVKLCFFKSEITRNLRFNMVETRHTYGRNYTILFGEQAMPRSPILNQLKLSSECCSNFDLSTRYVCTSIPRRNRIFNVRLQDIRIQR